MTSLAPNTPVLVGVAQYGDRDTPPERAPSPLDMLARVACQALQDSHAAGDLSDWIDAIAVVRSFFDSAPAYHIPGVSYGNLPLSLARRLGITPSRYFYPQVGGNTPQWLVNIGAEMIARGEVRALLIAGAEAMRTAKLAREAGLALDWRDEPGGAYEAIGDARPGVSAHEMAHGLGLPVNTYPLFENALGHHYGRTPAAQRHACGALFAPFTEVAAANPLAAFPAVRSAEALATPSAGNRMIAYPYTKALCAQMYVDEAAAVILTSVAEAQKLGVPREKWVFLHGCADTTEKWLVSERIDYHSSPAIKIGGAEALAMAGIGLDEVAAFDLYSCFPSAVEVACDALGLAHDDARGLTVTGGLPFFGGPGNNYTMHAIAAMAGRLRQAPQAYGFVSANGWYLTKHSFGVYSARPPAAPFVRARPASYQGAIDAMPSPPFVEQASGTGKVETYTVVYQKDAPALAIFIARSLDSGARFLATARDPSILAQMIDQPVIGRRLVVTHERGRNQAAFA
ncbi:MAG: acetyl-CoA acetyltransferase [Pseudomonadota bacterium]